MDSNNLQALTVEIYSIIEQMVNKKMETIDQVISAVVTGINNDGTVNIRIPPNSTEYHNIQNQSIYVLHVGDNVKVFKEKNSLSNCWIIGGFGLHEKPTDDLEQTVEQTIWNAYLDDRRQVILDAHPIGSYYWSSNDTDPQQLFGGTWVQIKDRFILAVGDTYHEADVMDGVAEVALTESQMPKHRHTPMVYDGAFSVQNTQIGTATGTTLNVLTVKNVDPIDNRLKPSEQGSNAPHNNMPPYLTAYCWKRIA